MFQHDDNIFIKRNAIRNLSQTSNNQTVIWLFLAGPWLSRGPEIFGCNIFFCVFTVTLSFLLERHHALLLRHYPRLQSSLIFLYTSSASSKICNLLYNFLNFKKILSRLKGSISILCAIFLFISKPSTFEITAKWPLYQVYNGMRYDFCMVI